MKYIKVFEKFINETRNKDIYAQMKSFFHNTPIYVFKEFFYAHNGTFKTDFINLINNDADEEEIMDFFSDWTDIEWKKQVVEVNISDFTKNTQDFMKEREIGNLNITDIPDDEKRNKLHKNLYIKNYGNNEPVIILDTPEGYELLEGWHRTMSILNLGSDNTKNYNNWKKVKLNAWIGYS